MEFINSAGRFSGGNHKTCIVCGERLRWLAAVPQKKIIIIVNKIVLRLIYFLFITSPK